MDGRVLQTAKVCGVIPKSRGQLEKTWQVHIVSPWTSKTQIMKGKKKEKKRERNKEGKVKQNQWRNNIPYICQKKKHPIQVKECQDNYKYIRELRIQWSSQAAKEMHKKAKNSNKNTQPALSTGTYYILY